MAWDNTFSMYGTQDLYKSMAAKTVDLCTVRSPSVKTASLGTLYWTLIAAKASAIAKQVNIYDFPDKGAAPQRLPVEELAELFHLPSNVRVYKAEDIDREFAWEQLHALRGKTVPGIHPRVAAELVTMDGDRPKGLERMAEELAVFLLGHDDPQRVQLSSHEHETAALLRAVPASVAKQLYLIETGIDGSEFRRDRIPDIDAFADRLVRGRAQGEHYHRFYKHVLGDLTDHISAMAEQQHPMPPEEDIEKRWSDDARRNGRYHSTTAKYQTRLDEREKEFSISMFHASACERTRNDRTATALAATHALDASLFPHVLLQAGDRIQRPYAGDPEYRRVSDQIHRSITSARPADIDLEYAIDLLCIHPESVPSVVKDALVTAMMAEYKEEIPPHIVQKLTDAHAEMTIEKFNERKKKASLTPAERVERAKALKAQAEQERWYAQIERYSKRSCEEEEREEADPYEGIPDHCISMSLPAEEQRRILETLCAGDTPARRVLMANEEELFARRPKILHFCRSK